MKEKITMRTVIMQIGAVHLIMTHKTVKFVSLREEVRMIMFDHYRFVRLVKHKVG